MPEPRPLKRKIRSKRRVQRGLPTGVVKPPYRVMSMDEIRAVPWNGRRVASFFAGCGGSSTGYRMEGFRVYYANEWDEHARQVYALNKADYTTLDGRDVAAVEPEDVLAACGVGVGELDVLDGSPPCQSFSSAGRRRVNDPRGDLFHQYARILRGVMPKVFVAENVAGMARGTAVGNFQRILADLEAAGYRVAVRQLDAQWLGVPQVRNRLIFVGVRKDLPAEPAHPLPLPYRYTMRDALPHVLRFARPGTFQSAADGIEHLLTDADGRPSPTMVATPPGRGKDGNASGQGTGWVEVLTVSYDTGGTQTPNGPEDVTDEPSPPILASPKTAGHLKVERRVVEDLGSKTFRPNGPTPVLDQPSPTIVRQPKIFVETRAVATPTGQHGEPGDLTEEPHPTVTATNDSHVHLVTKVEHAPGGDEHARHTVLGDVTDEPAPAITAAGHRDLRVVTRRELVITGGPKSDPESGWAKLQGKRFDQDGPSPAVQASGISGVYPAACPVEETFASGEVERRTLTIPELIRICAFPDDFKMVGPKNKRWARLGNSVPPVMMAAVARVVRDQILAQID